MLSTTYASQREENRKMLLVILSSVRCLGNLGGQGLALRGRYKVNDDSTVRGEIKSNFMQLLRLRAEDSPGILKWIDRPQNRFTSPHIQNEILSIMALHILRDITSLLIYLGSGSPWWMRQQTCLTLSKW